MLPSMPILITRDSLDAFGNKIEPNTSFFSQNSISKTAINPEPPPVKSESPPPKEIQINVKTTESPEKIDAPKQDENPLETALVRNYYRKVKSRFASDTSLPTNKFVQFQEILQTFNPAKETPVDLYKKIEELFGEEHKDILEEFLLFLKPGQAAEIGRFIDHFMLVQMSCFIDLLHRTFSRKPAVLRKILRAITAGINSGNSATMKARVQPLLRSNQTLLQMFKSLFPDERPPDSVYETGTDILDENFLTCDKGYDVWEFEDETSNKRKLERKERLDTMYIQGRVFLQHGRLLRPASVTYPYSKEPYRVHAKRLAPPQCHLSPPESDEERASPKRASKNTCKIPPKKTKKQIKSPTKSVKDVNDNTKHKECISISNKTAKAKSLTKNKSNKKEENKDLKKDKKDRLEVKLGTCAKKEEISKAKPAKLEAKVKVENKTLTKDEEKTTLDVKMGTCAKKEEISKTKPAKVDTAKIKVENKNWTRDEDKTMLQVLKGEAGSKQIFGRIRELLPHRSPLEIKERFSHVMNLLQQMAVGEVT